MDRNAINRKIRLAVVKGINEAFNEMEMDEGWKHAALGAAMGLSLLGSVPSCTPINEPTRQTQNMESDWLYSHLIGTEFDAAVLELDNRNKELAELQIDHIQYRDYFGDDAEPFVWYDGDYVKEKSGEIDGDHVVDYYCVSKMGPHHCYLEDEVIYIAIHYEKDERKPMSERIVYLTLFHTFEDREETEFRLNIDKIRNSGNRNYWRIYD